LRRSRSETSSGWARKHVDTALAINPKLSNAQNNLAQILEKEGKTEEGMAAYLKELENSPHHFKAIYNLSRLYRLLGQEDDEFNCLKKAIEIDASFPLSYFYLARIYLNRGENLDFSPLTANYLFFSISALSALTSGWSGLRRNEAFRASRASFFWPVLE
jgi:tetratricopeptide (TPR) repeat protein